MVRYSFLVRLSHPLLHAGLSRRILDHLIRPLQHVRWNREADLLGCFEVNEKQPYGAQILQVDTVDNSPD
jgi:hypothetical protein